MKKIILATLAMSALLSAPAVAEPAAAMFNWTGFYVGADAGALFGDSTVANPSNAVFASPNSSGFLYGGHVGYRYQFATNWVAGIEGQLWGVTGYDSRAPYSSGFVNDGILDVKHGYAALGTLGYTIHPQLLVYGAGGWSSLHYTGCSTVSHGGPCGAGGEFSSDPSAFTWGGGIAILVNPNLILRFQYLYADYGNKNLITPAVAGGVTSTDLKTNMFTAGLSWKFGN